MIKTLQIFNILSFVGMIAVNYLSNTGLIAGETMSSISAKYENLFTPAGYAFSIWGVIYIFLLAFVIYQAKGLFSRKEPPAVVAKIGGWFILSCVMNILWIFAWLNEWLGISVVLIGILLFSLVRIIVKTRMELDDEPLPVIAFFWWPFSFYSGWITVAVIANIAAYLTGLRWQGFGISEEVWTLLMILVAGLVNLVITWTRNMREFALVGVWALVAIAVANWSSESWVAEAALLLAGVLLVSSSVHAYKNRAYSPWKKL